MMLFKQVKEYSKRQRIDINKSDGLTPGADVVIMTSAEYENITNDLAEMQDKLISAEKQIHLLENQEQNLKEVIQNVTAPIYENHKKELLEKDNQIKQKQVQLDLMKNKTNQYNLDLMGLNAFDIVIRGKHKKLIKSYSEEITLIGADPNIIDADVRAISGNDNDLQE